jgi:hypothetical protein
MTEWTWSQWLGDEAEDEPIEADNDNDEAEE